MAGPQNDFPHPTAPTYSTLDLTSEEVVTAPDIARVTGPLLGKSCEDKNAWVIFTLKVICIFILQSISVGVVLGIFVYYQIVMKQQHIILIWVAAGICLIAIIVMAAWACIDQVKSRKIYNYIMLVFSPIAATFFMVMVPTLFNMHFQSKLRQAFLFSWMILILAGSAVLILGIFSLDCKHQFTLMKKFIITISVFSISCFGVYMPLYMDHNSYDLSSSMLVTVFLYLYFLYILYDIDVMTSGHYRSPLTPADYVTGAVNMHIDFLFIIRGFIKNKCCCGNVQ